MRKNLTLIQLKEYKRLSHNVKSIRKMIGWTQVETAKKCGIAFNTYIGIEHMNNNPRADVLIKIADTFGCTMERLWRGKL